MRGETVPFSKYVYCSIRRYCTEKIYSREMFKLSSISARYEAKWPIRIVAGSLYRCVEKHVYSWRTIVVAMNSDVFEG